MIVFIVSDKPSISSLVDPGAILQAYMAHEEVACKHPSKTHFNAAYRIFVRQEFTAAGPSVPLQKELTVAGPSVPPQAFNQEDATQDPSQRPVTLEDVHQRLKNIRLQMSESKKRQGLSHLWILMYNISIIIKGNLLNIVDQTI